MATKDLKEPEKMMSPDCRDGCAERPDNDPFHYYYHLKSSEHPLPETAPDYGYHHPKRHKAAADWLATHDLGGADPLRMVSAQYTIPEGAAVLPVRVMVKES